MPRTHKPEGDPTKLIRGEDPGVQPLDPLAPMSREERALWDIVTDVMIRRVREEDAEAARPSPLQGRTRPPNGRS